MFFAYLFQLLKQLGQTLTDNIGIRAYAHKICVSVPSWNKMDVEMLRQAGPCASAEIHTDIEAVGFYRQGQGFLQFSDEFHHFQQLFVGRLVKVGDVSGRRYQ